MAKIFNLPAVGDTMVEGEIVTWFVAVGDVVDLDQPICSLETDKSVVEMTTPHRGTVLYLAADVGGVVQVGAPLIVVGEPGEDLPADLLDPPTAPAAVSSPAAPSAPAAPTTSAPSTSSPAKNGWSQGPPPSNAPSLIPTSSPLLRRFAQEEGVNLATVRGTGPGGRITRADVTAAAGGAPAQPSISRGPVLALPKVRKIARDGGIDLRDVRGSGPHGSITMTDLAAVAPELAQPVRGERVRMSTMRRAIARNLTGAAEVPQFTSMMDFDATSLLARRAALRDTLNGPVPLDALLMHDLTVVLSEHRLMNAQLVGDSVEYFDAFDIGVAVDTEHGLMVPVVRAADTLDFAALSREIVRLSTAARNRTITPGELTGGTCTVNNIGALGIVAGTPILPLGTSTIVAFGAARPTVRMHDGVPVEVPMATLSATFDHRIIDGGDSARFLAALRTQLEAPQ